MRQKYFDSTEYNYQYYYKIDRNEDNNNAIIKEGKQIANEESYHSNSHSSMNRGTARQLSEDDGSQIPVSKMITKKGQFW